MKIQTGKRCVVEGLEARRLLADTLSASIDAAQAKQTIDGIGGAMAAWSQTNEYRSSAYYDQIAGDLGASIVRAAIWSSFEPTNDNNDPNVIDWSGFDERALSNAMQYLQQMQARGVNQFLLTVWTPSSWMKTNSSSSHGGHVRADLREEFAEYVSAALQLAKSKWGVSITHLSIANEPWFIEQFGSTQHTPVQLRELLKVVDARLQRDGLGEVKLVVPEDVSRLNRTFQYLDAIEQDPQALSAVDLWGSHYLNPQDQATLRNRLGAIGKNIWYTEVGNGSNDFAGAMGIARGVDTAFTQGGATGYVNWLISAPPGISTFETLMGGPTPLKKYYALKQFSHFVRPGAKLLTSKLSGDAVRVTSFKHPTTGAITIVMSNNRTTDVDLTVNLKGTSIPASFRQVRTTATENTAELDPVVGASSMLVHLPAGSIVTLYNGPELTATSTIAPPTRVATPAPTDAWNTNDLREAAMLGNQADVQALIAGGANVDAAFGDGWTALFTAAASPYATSHNIIDDLIAAGADVNKRDTEQMTALHVVAMNPNLRHSVWVGTPAAKAQKLIDAGADVDARDGYGRTPLHYAGMYAKIIGDLQTISFDTSIITTLLNAGANPNAVDGAGIKPIDYARAEGFTAAIPVLQQAMGTGLVTISGKFFIDTNQNGTLEEGENGAGGRTVWLDLDNDGKLDGNEPRQVAGLYGDYQFIELNPGTYHVRQLVPAGYVGTTMPYTLNLVADTDAIAIDFGSIPQPGTSLIAAAYRDTDKDATRDANEPGLAGVTIYLDLDDNEQLDAAEPTAVTNSNGEAFFSNVADGSYRVRAVLSGYDLTEQVNGLVTINSTTIPSVRFGLTPSVVNPPPTDPMTASIGGYLFNDANANGVQDGTETRTGIRTVFIDTNRNGKLDSGEKSTSSNAQGVYSFSGLAAGTYYVTRVFPSGWRMSNNTDGYLTVTLTAAQAMTGINIGTTDQNIVNPPPPPTDPMTASIGGYLFNDANANGVQDGTETRTGIRTVFIDTNRNGKLDSGEKSTSSNSQGVYSFTGLAAGTYYVTRVFPSGWRMSNNTDGYLTVTLAAAQAMTGINIGTTDQDIGTPPPPPPPPPPPGGSAGVTGTVVNDLNKSATWNNGENGIAGRVVFIDADNDAILDADETRVVTDSSGKFAFANLAAGSYLLRQVVPDGWVQTKPSPQYGLNVTLVDGDLKKNWNFYVAQI